MRFTPVFTLEVHNALRKEVEGSAKAFVEQYIPIVLPAIRAREDKNREFLTSAQMPQKELRVGETVWGVATWQDIDPNNVWFSVYVEGLTNAYKFTDDPAKYAAYRRRQGAVSRNPHEGPEDQLLAAGRRIYGEGDPGAVRGSRIAGRPAVEAILRVGLVEDIPPAAKPFRRRIDT